MIKILEEEPRTMIVAEGLKNFENLNLLENNRCEFRADACCHTK